MRVIEKFIKNANNFQKVTNKSKRSICCILTKLATIKSYSRLPNRVYVIPILE